MSIDYAKNALNSDIPFVPQTIPRPTVEKQLEYLENFRVTLVSAPPGYGKTTVVAQHARKSNLPWAWQTIQEPDRDLPSLHLNALRALELIAPGIVDAVQSSTHQSPHDAASSIAHYLREKMHGHFVYVLDDVHVIAGFDQVETWLSMLIELLPARCHLILISRTIPDIPLAELISRGDVLAIGQDVLKFGEHDVAALQTLSREPTTREDLLSRIDYLEGWPAGVLAAVQPLPEHIQLMALRGQKGPEALFEVLAELAIQRLPPTLRDFLLAIAIPDKISPEFALKVLNFRESHTLLSEILNRNLFVHQVTGGLVFHRLFRNFLQRTLERVDSERFRQLHLKAGEWFREANDYSAAFNHFVAAHALDATLDLVEQMHSALFSQGRIELLLYWQRVLAQDAQRIPRFIFTCAMVHTDRYLFAQAQEEVDAVKRIAAQTGDFETLAEAELQEALISLRKGDYQSVETQARSIMTNPNLSEHTVGRAKHLLARTYSETGRVEASIALFEEVLGLYEFAGNTYALGAVLQDLEIAYTRTGRVSLANECLKRLVTIQRKLNSPTALALVLNNLGYHYHQRGLYDEAMSTFEEGFGIIADNPNPRARSYLLWSMGDLFRDLGNFSKSLDMYNTAYELAAESEQRLAFLICLSISTLYRWRGDYAIAKRVADDAIKSYRGHPDDPDMLVGKAISLVSSAFVGNPASVKSELEEILIQLEHTDSKFEVFRTATLCSIVALLDNDASGAKAYFDRGFVQTFAEFGSHTLAVEVLRSPPLMELVLADDKYGSVLDIISRIQNYGGRLGAKRHIEQEVAVAPHTYTLRIFTLGQEIIERDGSFVPSTDWAASKARELFFLLLFEGPTNRASLSLMMWPDTNTARVRSNFHTTLYRIRRALGENSILYEDNKYLINPQVDIWCDAFTLIDSIERADLLSPRDVLAEDLYLKAIKLYKGPFLPDMDADWIDGWRRKLEDIYIQGVIGSGRCATARSDYLVAIERLQQALFIDPYREQIYREIFSSLAKMGEHQLLVEKFAAMKKLFNAELGVSPSRKTIEFVQQLTNR